MSSCGMSRKSETAVPALWQRPQSRGTFMTETGERGSSWGRMACVPWQVAQVGASRSPRAAARAGRLPPRASAPRALEHVHAMAVGARRRLTAAGGAGVDAPRRVGRLVLVAAGAVDRRDLV